MTRNPVMLGAVYLLSLSEINRKDSSKKQRERERERERERKREREVTLR